MAHRALLVSAGKRMKVDVAKKNLLGRALERPDGISALTPLGHSCAAP